TRDLVFSILGLLWKVKEVEPLQPYLSNSTGGGEEWIQPLEWRGQQIYERGQQIYERGQQIYERGQQIYERGQQIYERGQQIYEAILFFVKTDPFASAERKLAGGRNKKNL
ncbi:hypothetical protein ACJX0J_032855, partial [Zea mays]